MIRLLGRPSIEADGAPVRPPRGRKSWAVLTYVLLAERPPSRRHLAGLLFGDADDPLGALRWSVAEVRRALRPHAEVGGDPLTIAFVGDEPPTIDVLAIDDADVVRAGEGELLEGMSFDGSDAFETWLLVERRRLTGVVESALHEDALHHLALGHTADATALASRLVTINPLDENFQELLIRCLASSGQRDAALRQAEQCRELMVRELGVEPSPSVRQAAELRPGALSPPPSVGRAAARAQLEAGRAAIAAGAVDAGLDCLRRAVVEGEGSGDDQLHGAALVELGGALVHSVRGRDEEGSAVLHEGLAVAVRSGDQRLAATASRELGFVDVQAGRRTQADAWLVKAEALADGDDAELGSILGVRGMNLLDRAYHADALATFDRSIEHSARAGAKRQHAWSLSLVARAHLEMGRTADAWTAIDRSLEITRDERWTAFAPWPEAVRAEIDLNERDLDTAMDRYSHAFALACQVGDPCWEGMAAKGLGMTEAERGDLALAMTWLDDGYIRSTRWPDGNQWVTASVLDVTCGVAIARGDERAPSLVERFATLAAKTDMRLLVVHSHVHRGRLGQPGAVEAAAAAAATIDNPVLTELVEDAARDLVHGV